MARKPSKSRRPSDVEIWKGIRKDPNPPGRTIQPKDRELRDDRDEDQMRRWKGWRGEDLDEYDEEQDT